MPRLLLSVLCLLVLAAPAAAQEPSDPVPVARGGGYTVAVYTDRGQECLQLRRGRNASMVCAGGSGPEPDVAQATPYDSDARPLPFAALVPARAAYVTVAGERIETQPVKGFAHRLAFRPAVGRGRAVRLFAADGALLGAVKDQNARPRNRATLYRRDGLRLRIQRDFEVEADLLKPDRVIPTVCLNVVGGDGIAGDCTPVADVGLEPLEVASSCRPRRGVLHGLVPRGVRRVDVLLGDGRIERAPARPLGRYYGGVRFVALPVGARDAVVSATVRGRRGVRRTDRLRLPPIAARCAGAEALGFANRARPNHAAPTVLARAGGRRVLIADAQGRRLCLGVSRIEGRMCIVPTADEEDAGLLRDRGVVFGWVPEDTTSVELVGRDGERRAVAPTTGSAYTGRYAGRLRFVAVADRDAVRVRLSDAAGGVVRGPIVDLPRLLRNAPVPRAPLRAIAYTDPFFGREGCVGILSAGVACGPGDSVLVTRCDPRGTLVFGVLGRRADPPRVRLADGRVLSPRRVRTPAGRAWLVRVPPRAALAAVGDQRLRLPAAAAQCGYSVQL